MTVITIGEVVVDWISTTIGADFTSAREFVRSLGGNASNVAIGLSRLGTKVKLIGKRGNDAHGRYLESILAREGVDLEHMFVDERFPTAQCYVFRYENEDYTFLNWPRPNASHRLFSEEIDETHLKNASFLHATGISLTVSPRREAVIKAMELAKESGVAISFDAGFPTGDDEEANRSARSALSLADLVKVNLAELKFWAEALHRSGGLPDLSNPADSNPHPLQNPERAPCPVAGSTLEIFDGTYAGLKAIDSQTGAISDWVLELSRSLVRSLQDAHVVVTLGCEGAMLVKPDGDNLFMPAHKVEAVSELGAGDAFVAGMLHALADRLKVTAGSLSGLDIESWRQALNYASAVGALSTSSITAWEGLPTSQSVDEFL